MVGKCRSHRATFGRGKPSDPVGQSCSHHATFGRGVPADLSTAATSLNSLKADVDTIKTRLSSAETKLNALHTFVHREVKANDQDIKSLQGKQVVVVEEHAGQGRA